MGLHNNAIIIKVHVHGSVKQNTQKPDPFDYIDNFGLLVRFSFQDTKKNYYVNKANQRMTNFPKTLYVLLLDSAVTLNLFLDTVFALYCIRRQIGFSMSFSCRVVFRNVAQRKIGGFTDGFPT